MDPGVTVLWIPLGAGGHSVRFNGRVFEAVCAWREHRSPLDVYHAALEVRGAHRWVIEMAPAWSDGSPDRGVVVQGPVGSRLLGGSRWFRYEVRSWRDGVLPDAAEAVGPCLVSADPARAQAVLDRVREVPALVWGRDELGAGDMWNSNSLVAWLLATTGHAVHRVQPPAGGCAPGWRSGLALAARQHS